MWEEACHHWTEAVPGAKDTQASYLGAVRTAACTWVPSKATGNRQAARTHILGLPLPGAQLLAA